MGKFEPTENNSIVELTCTTCHINIIYLKVQNYESNTDPFNSTQFTCTECNQGLMPNISTVE